MSAEKKSPQTTTARRSRWRRLGMAALVVCASAPVIAQQQAAPDPLKASLEDLMNMEVTSAGRKEQRMTDVAAAVYVITRDDIRRSGLTSVPELLRLAPGVQVAQIDASKWAISIRGFDNRWSDKLLVLVDGRSIYTRQFSGVLWDSVGVILEDIDRIEVIRGPGGAVWGANAVNGVINIITRSSADAGGYVRASGGSQAAGEIVAGYGRQRGATSWRVSMDGAQHARSMLTASAPESDGWSTVQASSRLDRTTATSNLVALGNAMVADTNLYLAMPTGVTPPPGGWQPSLVPTRAVSSSALVRWTLDFSSGRSIEFQGSADHMRRHDAIQVLDSGALDFDATYHGQFASHELVTGVGYRASGETSEGTFFFQTQPSHVMLYTFDGFVQDEWRLPGDHVRLTGGAKIEHDTYMGWAVQPSGRVLVLLSPSQRLWGSMSRALRAPSVVNRSMRVNFTTFPTDTGLPGVVSIFGNPGYLTEETTSVEGGYRVEHGRVSFDLATFFSHHERLASLEPLPVQVETAYGQPDVLIASRMDNLLGADARGVEVASRWAPSAWLRLEGTATGFDFTPHPSVRSLDPAGPLDDGSAPRFQMTLRPSITKGRFEADVFVSRVSALRNLGVPAYTRVDANLGWAIGRRWSAGFTAQNLTDAHHLEFVGQESAATSMEQPRRATVHLSWRF